VTRNDRANIIIIVIVIFITIRSYNNDNNADDGNNRLLLLAIRPQMTWGGPVGALWPGRIFNVQSSPKQVPIRYNSTNTG
jgi:hypothetical protein